MVANHSSYVDLLYFYFRFTPVFTEILGEDKIRAISLWEALWRCGKGDSVGSAIPGQTLEQLSLWSKKNRRGPILLFPEVCYQKGKGSWMSMFQGDHGEWKGIAAIPSLAHSIG